MKRIFTTVLFVLICFLALTSSAWAEQRIINGSEASASDWPFFAMISSNEGELYPHCGGTLVAPRWVVTAGHCVVPDDLFYNSPETKVNVGKTAVTSTLELSAQKSREIYVAENYRQGAYTNNDIALVHLPKASSKKVAPLATGEPAADDVLLAAGIGASDLVDGNFQYPDKLLEAPVLADSADFCENLYPTYFDAESMICVKSNSSQVFRGTCFGDSGGPLMQNGLLVGITNWGTGCQDPNLPTAFAKISHWRSWILGTMKNYKTVPGVLLKNPEILQWESSANEVVGWGVKVASSQTPRQIYLKLDKRLCAGKKCWAVGDKIFLQTRGPVSMNMLPYKSSCYKVQLSVVFKNNTEKRNLEVCKPQ